jgi:hypothetical protein
MLCLAGCASDQSNPIDPSASDQTVAFHACKRQAWHEWAHRPHLAYAFGALGALIDASATDQSTSDQIRQCMLAHGYTNAEP